MTSCGGAQKHDVVIVDGPWKTLPSCAGKGLTLDKEWGAMTLESDMAKQVFVLMP